MVASSANVPAAFGLVCMSGFSTAIGSAVVFFPALVNVVNRKTLAASLAISAGVMTYVSFVAILQTSHASFIKAGHGSGGAYFYTTICFFAGVLMMVFTNMLIHSLTGGHNHQHSPPPSDPKGDVHDHGDEEKSEAGSEASHHHNLGVCPCDTDISQLYKIAHQIEEKEGTVNLWGGIQGSADANEPEHDHCSSRQNNPLDEDRGADEILLDDGCGVSTIGGDEETGTGTNTYQPQVDAAQQRKLLLSSINTAVAISAHNFPEGIATFVSALADPSMGAVLAVAIAIHNIPEGICVSLPIYYATGNRVRAFLWGMLSGMSEIFAALLGWLILADHMGSTVFGVLYGLVGGMMVIISIKELLPTAHRYDPDDSLVTTFFILGMGVMALSLVLFTA